ncbi:MAG TPA: DNA alkylation repair protein [Acidimicrobiia bacterium]|nr:DNA alkylation repair protein [Acidimicrobiia bacterium]
MDSAADTRELVEYVQSELALHADPEAARAMAAYMKTGRPFYGVKKPQRVPIDRHIRQAYAPVSPSDYQEKVLALWRLPHREEKYLAIGYSNAFPGFLTLDQIDLFEHMVVEGAWWDFVDDLASRNIGAVVRSEREAMRPVLEAWIDHDDMWLRRTALLSQLRHKEDTDAAMLFDFCLRRSGETEFFIRKAIGWALREYSRTDPDAVHRFLDAHQNELSGLSRREAGRHL